MNKVHYLEPDEEITKVINRIRQSEEDGVVLVVPRNSTLAQSMINLKLLKRSALEHKKAIGLVSTDRITKNLAEQLKIGVFSKVTEAEKAMLKSEPLPTPSVGREDSAVKVNTYKKYDLSKMNEKDQDSGLGTQDLGQGNEPPASGDGDVGDIELSKKPLADAIGDVPETVDEEPAEENAESPEPSQEEEFKVPEVALENNNKDDDMRYKAGTGRHIRTGGSRKPLIIIFGIIVLAFAIIIGIFLPSAQASVTLKTTDLDQKAAISIDKNQKDFDSAKAVLQGTMVEVEKSASKTINSTGQKDAGTAATGTVTISNALDTKAIPVSPGTKVTATDGKVFTVASGVLVPGAVISNPQLVNGKLTYDTTPGTVDAKVTATANGDSYNLAASTKFTVGTMTATNKEAFIGGVTKNIAFVTEDDLAKAEATMKDATLTDNKAELLDNATKAEVKVIEKNITISVISFSADKKANDQADTFAVTADVKLSALGFSESDLRGAMAILAGSQLKDDVMLVNPDSSEMTYTVSGWDADTNILKLDVVFKGKTGAKMSAETLAKNLKGKSATAAQNYLAGQNGVAAVSIKYTPSFWRMMPFMTNRIHVNFDYQK